MPYRNSEKRKEKSRDAARSRRGKESEVFDQLGQCLPVSSTTLAQLDKASIMRVAISHLRLRKLFGYQEVDRPVTSCQSHSLMKKDKMDSFYPKAMEGFLLLITQNGDLTYVSESVSLYLGLTQLDLIGHSIYDFSHPCDHEELQELLQEKASTAPKDSKPAVTCHERDFFVRMKCTLTSKGKSVNLKSATYKVMHCSGHYVTSGNASEDLVGLQDDPSLSCLMVVAEPIPHPANIEIPLDSRTFLSRHSLNMKFTYCDDRVDQLLHYSGSELIGRSIYEYQHALDTDSLDKAFKTLFSKGQTVTGKYRFLARGGGYAWVETQATVIYDSRTEKPQCVVCVNFVLSGIEEKGVILSKVQCAEESVSVVPKLEKDIRELKFSTTDVLMKHPAAEPVVTKKPGYMNLELEDLAPVASDTTALDDDDLNLYDDVLFPARHSLLPQQPPVRRKDPPLTKANVAAAAAKISNDVLKTISKKDLPFISLREDIVNGNAECSLDSGPSSPASSLQTNSSLDSPPALINLSIQSDNSCTPQQKYTDIPEPEIDMEFRAPYISMDEKDDLTFGIREPAPLFEDNELGSKHMLGITESVFCANPDFKLDAEETNPHQLPMHILRLQANNKNLPSVGDIARNAGPPKIKRPMETNRLETGPPVVKLGRFEIDVPQPLPSASYDIDDDDTMAADSILKNLLIKGEDVNYGYKLEPLTQTYETDHLHSICGQVTPDDSPVSSPASQQQQLRSLLLETQPLQLQQQPEQLILLNNPQALQQLLVEARMLRRF